MVETEVGGCFDHILTAVVLAQFLPLINSRYCLDILWVNKVYLRPLVDYDSLGYPQRHASQCPETAVVDGLVLDPVSMVTASGCSAVFGRSYHARRLYVARRNSRHALHRALL